jgi:uncharacterized protein YeaO (DUF488 family)
VIEAKKIYGEPAQGDGFRILTDRLWPRGLRKDQVEVDLWMKEIAPSDELRKWFGHDPEKWKEFKRRYFKELDNKKDLVDQILDKSKRRKVVLLYGAKEKRFNNAVALKEYVETRITQGEGV